MTVVHEVCEVEISFAVTGGDDLICGRCFAPVPVGSVAVIAEHSACGHVLGYCPKCSLFQCMLSDAEYGGHLASEFLAYRNERTSSG